MEIHKGGDLDEATFKWSRDNGCVVFALEEFVSGGPTKVKVKRLGRDQVLALREGDWVEVLDDATELSGQPGTLAQITDLDDERRILTLSKPIPGYDPNGHPKVRRWDQKETTAVALKEGAVPVQEDEWLEVEDGIRIKFRPGGTYQTGDYWVFAARTAPTSEGEPFIEELVEAPPRGIKHHYCRLALVTWKTEQVERILGSLREGVFKPDLAKSYEVSSTHKTWTFELNPGMKMPDGGVLKASIVGEVLKADTRFRRNLRYISAVHDLTIRIALKESNPQLLDELRKRPIFVEAKKPVVQVRDCRKLFPPLTDIAAEVHETWPAITKIDWTNDQPMTLEDFNKGLTVTFSKPMKLATVSLDTFIVTLEVPCDEGQPAFRCRGHRLFVVHGNVEVDGDGRTWTFNPLESISPGILAHWLEQEEKFFEVRVPRIRCRVVLKGNTILDEGGRPLGGDVFGEVVDDSTGAPYTELILPSGDGNKGGDFESWFYLVLRTPE